MVMKMTDDCDRLIDASRKQALMAWLSWLRKVLRAALTPALAAARVPKPRSANRLSAQDMSCVEDKAASECSHIEQVPAELAVRLFNVISPRAPWISTP